MYGIIRGISTLLAISSLASPRRDSSKKVSSRPSSPGWPCRSSAAAGCKSGGDRRVSSLWSHGIIQQYGEAACSWPPSCRRVPDSPRRVPSGTIIKYIPYPIVVGFHERHRRDHLHHAGEGPFRLSIADVPADFGRRDSLRAATSPASTRGPQAWGLGSVAPSSPCPGSPARFRARSSPSSS